MADYGPIFEAAGKQYDVDPKLLAAVAQAESAGNPNAVSPAGAVGLMQFMPQTAQAMGVKDPTDPTQAIPGAAKYLSQLIQKYGNVPDALREYNAGPDQTHWGNPETLAYVGRVAQAYNNLGKATSAPKNDQQALDVSLAKLRMGQPVGQGTSSQLAQADTGSMSDAQPTPMDQAAVAAADRAWGVGGDDAAKPAGAAPAISPQAIATMDAQWGVGQADKNAAAPQPQGVLDKVGAGIVRAGHDMLDVPAELLARGSDYIGLTNGQAPQVAANDQAALQSFNQNYGQSLIAQGTRVAGDVAGTLAPMAAGGRLLTGAVDAVAPNVAAAIRGNALGRAAAGIGSGALQGAAGAALTAGGSDESVPTQVEQGALAGAAFGAAAPAVVGVAKTIASPFANKLAPATAALAQKAVNMGIPLDVGQVSSNPLINFTRSALAKVPGMGLGERTEAQQTAFNKALAQTMGANADRITPDVMQATKTRLGNVFNGVAAKTTIQADNQFMGDLGKIQADIAQTLPASEQAPINAQLTNVLEAAVQGNGAIDGKTYQALTSKGAPLDRAMQSSDPNIRFYAGQIRDSLDDALQRSASPDDVKALQTARAQYKAMKTIEPLVAKSPTGDISPASLMGRVTASYKNKAQTGAGDIGTLADIGQAFLKAPPSSGTAERSLIYHMLLGGGGVAGAISNPGAIVPAALGYGAAKGVSMLLNSDLIRNRLIANAVRNNPNMAIRALNSGPVQSVVRLAPLAGGVEGRNYLQ